MVFENLLLSNSCSNFIFIVCNVWYKDWKTLLMAVNLVVDRFQSRGQQLCKLLGIKESFNMGKEFNSRRICFCTKAWPSLHCLVHKYGRRDVMWKRSIHKWPQIIYQVPQWNRTHNGHYKLTCHKQNRKLKKLKISENTIQSYWLQYVTTNTLRMLTLSNSFWVAIKRGKRMSSLSSLSRCGFFNNYSLKFRRIQAERMFVRDSHMKGAGMLVISLRGVNFRF